MAPAEELERLEYNRQTFERGVVSGRRGLPVKNGASFRIRAAIDMSAATRAGFSVRVSSDGAEHTDIYYDRVSRRLVFDATRSGGDGWRIKEEAPFEIKDGETLSLDLFVDQSVIEVYANERQAICRRVYPADPGSAVGVEAISDGARFERIEACEMARTNFY